MPYSSLAFETVLTELGAEADAVKDADEYKYWVIRRVITDLTDLWGGEVHKLRPTGDASRGKLVSEKLRLRRDS